MSRENACYLWHLFFLPKENHEIAKRPVPNYNNMGQKKKTPEFTFLNPLANCATNAVLFQSSNIYLNQTCVNAFSGGFANFQWIFRFCWKNESSGKGQPLIEFCQKKIDHLAKQRVQESYIKMVLKQPFQNLIGALHPLLLCLTRVLKSFSELRLSLSIWGPED